MIGNMEHAHITVVDYGIGNISSIVNMVRKIGFPVTVSNKPKDILNAEKLILPGVGSFDRAMKNLRDRGYLEVLTQRVIFDKTPIIGICLGMQLLTQGSEEGCEPGLGWIAADTVRFQLDSEEARLKIPHMGWGTVRVCKSNPIMPFCDSVRRFYFVHSYHVSCRDPEDVLATSYHGSEFTSAICKDNILGVQFHPEKSHKFGFELFRNFCNWVVDDI